MKANLNFRWLEILGFVVFLIGIAGGIIMLMGLVTLRTRFLIIGFALLYLALWTTTILALRWDI